MLGAAIAVQTAAEKMICMTMRAGAADPGIIHLGIGKNTLRLHRDQAERMLRDIRRGVEQAGWEAETIIVRGEVFSRAECEQIARKLSAALADMANLYSGCGE